MTYDTKCIDRESNPRRPHGRRAFYHWTIDEWFHSRFLIEYQRPRPTCCSRRLHPSRSAFSMETKACGDENIHWESKKSADYSGWIFQKTKFNRVIINFTTGSTTSWKTLHFRSTFRMSLIEIASTWDRTPNLRNPSRRRYRLFYYGLWTLI